MRPQHRIEASRSSITRHGDHGPGIAAGAQRRERAASRDRAVDDDRAQRLSYRCLEGGLPTFVDLDQIGERSDRAVDLTPPRVAVAAIEGKGERLRACRPHVPVGVGGAMVFLRCGELVLHAALDFLGTLQPSDEGTLSLLGLLARSPVKIAIGGELRRAPFDRGQTSLDSC